jgi:hypothetical protein
MLRGMTNLDSIIDGPMHYCWHPKVECFEVAQEFDYNLGVALSYIWRCKHKHPDAVEDISKAIKHLEFERARLNLLAQTINGTATVPSYEQDDGKVNY